MEAWQIALLAMFIYLIIAFSIGLAAGRGRSFFSISEYAVGDRGFGLFVMWFLMGGTIFSAFAFLGGPGWAYSKGAASLYILAYCCRSHFCHCELHLLCVLVPNTAVL